MLSRGDSMLRTRFKDLREDNNITQATIAEYLHVRQNTYCNYENGKHAMPLCTMIAFADYFEVNLDYLIGRTDEKEMLPKSKIWKRIE